MPGATRFAGSASSSRRPSRDITDAVRQEDVFLARDNGEASTTGHHREPVDLEAQREQIPLAQPVPIAAQSQRHNNWWEQPGEGDVEMRQFIQLNAHRADPHDPNSPTPPDYGRVYPPGHPIHQLFQQQGAHPQYVVMPPQQQQAPQRQESFVQALRNHWKAFGALGLLIAGFFGGEGYAIGNATKHCPAPVSNTPTTTPPFIPPWTPAPTPTFGFPPPPISTATSTPVIPPGIGGGDGDDDDCTNQTDPGNAGNSNGDAGNIGSANQGVTNGSMGGISGQEGGKGNSVNGIDKTNATKGDDTSQQPQASSTHKDGCKNKTQDGAEGALNSALSQLGAVSQPTGKASSPDKMKPED